MDGKHPNQYDKRPKRRKDKDNPYELLSVGMDTPTARYYIRFEDGQGVEHCMEIEKPLFDMLDGFEQEDISHLNEVDNHYEHSELTEASLNERAFEAPQPIEAIVNFKIECEELHRAIRHLPEIQRRRLLHFLVKPDPIIGISIDLRILLIIDSLTSSNLTISIVVLLYLYFDKTKNIIRRPMSMRIWISIQSFPRRTPW